MVSIQSKSLWRILVSLAFLMLSAASLAPKPAIASSGLFLGPQAMSPFYGQPYYGGPQCGGVGQMQAYGQCGVNPMAVFYGLNWTGAQPMGASYLTPIGLPTLVNRYNYVQMQSASSDSGSRASAGY